MVLSLPFIATSRTLHRTLPAVRAGSAAQSANAGPATPRPDSGPIAAPKHRSQGRFDIRQTACDQLRHAARERARLLLDIDHPQCSLALRLPRQPLAEPLVDDFEALHRVARGRIPAIEPVEYKEFIGWPPGSGDDVDSRHAAPRMGREDKVVHRERPSPHRLGKPVQAIVHQPIHSAREQGREIVPRISQPVAAG